MIPEFDLKFSFEDSRQPTNIEHKQTNFVNKHSQSNNIENKQTNLLIKQSLTKVENQIMHLRNKSRTNSTIFYKHCSTYLRIFKY